jgi:photosystem II stability/assembly factor-like uncharacterized protein
MKVYCFLVTLIIIISCSKENANPSPLDTKPDSLSTGWQNIKMPDKENFSDIYFVNSTIGYVLGTNALYKSIDGGSSWTRLSNRGYAGNIFVTADEKIFLVTPDSVFRSTDHGITFTGTKFVHTAIRLFDIYFTDNNKGFLPAGPNELYTTVNGGDTWEKTTPISGLNISGATLHLTPFFINDTTGWISNSKEVFKINGSIHNWIQSSFDATNIVAGNVSIYAFSPNIVFLGSYRSGKFFISKSIDGGTTFSLLSSIPGDIFSDSYTDIHFTDANTGYVSHDKRIYKTTDGGISWKKVVSLGENYIYDIHFTDANHGWACGTGGTILRFIQ